MKAERRAEGFTEEAGRMPGFTLGKIRRGEWFLSTFTESTQFGLVLAKTLRCVRHYFVNAGKKHRLLNSVQSVELWMVFLSL